MEKISVYIPCYNAEKFIIKAVKSILDQMLVPDQVAVIDDWCTDYTVELGSGLQVRIVHKGRN